MQRPECTLLHRKSSLKNFKFKGNAQDTMGSHPSLGSLSCCPSMVSPELLGMQNTLRDCGRIH